MVVLVCHECLMTSHGITVYFRVGDFMCLPWHTLHGHLIDVMIIDTGKERCICAEPSGLERGGRVG